MTADLGEVRLDRWLVAVRLTKTRSLAAQAIAGGRIKLNDESVKAHKTVKPGDVVSLKRGGRQHAYTVIKCIEKRVSASEAKTCYTLEMDPGLDESAKAMLDTVRDMARALPRPKGRPSKRDRRALDQLKNTHL